MKSLQWEGSLPPKEVLKQYQVLDTGSEEEFDQITRLAAYICETPISLVTILDGDRQFFKSHYGLGINQTPIDQSFCVHTLESPTEPLIVPDAREDQRFRENPLVVSSPSIVFYAGLPLINKEGVALGSLCVIDTKKRELTFDKLDALSILAKQVVQVLELRRTGLINEVVQHKLLEEREFNTDLIENIDGIFWIADPTTLEFRYISPQVERIMGYSPAEWKSDPHFWENHIHPADRERIVRSCSLAVENLENHQFDYQFCTKSGKYIWINDRVIVHSEDGKPVKLTGFFIDITTEMQLSQEIKERNEHYELINKATRDAIYDWDILKDELKFGQSFEKNYGHLLSPGKKVQLSLWESWVHPEDRDRTNLALDEFLKDSEEHKWEREYRMRRADGTYAYVEEIGLVVRNESGRAVRMAGVIRDISDYRKIEELLRQASEISLLGGWEADLKGKRIYFTDSTYTIHGLKIGDEQTFEQVLDFYRLDFRDMIDGKINQSITGGLAFEFEAILIRKDAVERWVKVKGIPEMERGECIRMTGSIMDIHIQKVAEETLNKKNRLQSSLTQIIQILLANRDWERGISKILQLVKDSAGLKHIYYCHLVTNESYASENSLVQGMWSAEGGPIAHTGMNDTIFMLLKEFNGKEKLWYSSEEIKGLESLLKEQGDNANANTFWIPVVIGAECFGYLAVTFAIEFKEESLQDEVGFLTNFSSSLASAIKRKVDQERLEEFSKEKERILESIGDGFFALDIDWNMVYWNRAAERMIGISREQLIGKNVWESFPETQELQFYAKFKEAMESQVTVHFEEFNPWEKRWYESFAYPTPVGLSVFFRDITDLKLIEERIESSNLRLRKVAEASNDAIWDWDLGKDMLFLGDGFKEGFGYEEEAWSTSFSDWMRHIHPKDYKRVVNSFRAAVSNTSISKWNDEYRFRTKNGEYRFVTNRAAILRDSAEEVVRVIGAVTDITGRKEYEQKLKGLNQTLRDYVKKLSESNQELEQFAYVASHDLQEPLRMISSFMGLLERRYSNHLDEKAKSYINYAVGGAVRMRKIILDLLEFSRVGREEITIEEFDFVEVVEEVKLLNKRLIREKKAEIRLIGQAKLLTNRSQLVQILHNLVGNSLKYMEEDKLPKISIRIKEKKSYWEIQIKDNGIGIREEDQERIFVIFQRLHSQSEYSGTGMGLSIVKKIVHHLGGKVRLKSEVGVGSKFYFSIPKNQKKG